MILENQKIISPKPKIPKILKEKINLFTNCDLTEFEVKLFNLCLAAVANHIEIDGINLSDFYRLNVFFTETGKISFHEDKEGVNGNQVYMAMYKLKTIREKRNTSFMAFIFIEELVHYFWRIYDETEVKYKNVEVMNDIFSDFTIDDAKEWGLYGL